MERKEKENIKEEEFDPNAPSWAKKIFEKIQDSRTNQEKII